MKKNLEISQIFCNDRHLATNNMQARYEIGPLIGTGAHGTVYKVRRRKTGETFAMKTILDCKETEIETMWALKGTEG